MSSKVQFKLNKVDLWVKFWRFGIWRAETLYKLDLLNKVWLRCLYSMYSCGKSLNLDVWHLCKEIKATRNFMVHRRFGLCSKKKKKMKKTTTTTNRRSWDLCPVAASTVLFMRSDRSRSHHSTSFLSASPPCRLQAWSTASLGVHNASLFALFESSADACHIWSTKYYRSARWTSPRTFMQSRHRKRSRQKWGVYAEIYLQCDS